MAILFCFASCDNGSTSGGNPQDSQSSINYSLGDPPDESKRIYNFKIEENPNGIYLEFPIPENTFDGNRAWIQIDGIGQVAEEFHKESEANGSFFYPFLEPNKTYTIRMVFEKDEIRNGDFVISSGDVINWFETKVTAGANSKGEVRLKYKGAIEVKNTGDFRFTKKPEFYGESALTGKDYDGKDYDWKENIGLVEGISWEHGDARKTKWRAQFPIPNAELTKWCNLYTDAGTKGWKDSEFIKIDFLCIRPCLGYNYNDKTYNYQWENFCYETPYLGDEALLWTTIDINNPADVAKIKGTWEYSQNEEGNYQLDDDYYIQMKGKCTETVNIIDQNTLIATFTDILNKKDGTPFTEEEQAHWNFGNKDYGEDDEIYTRNVTISDDKRTITEIYHRETTLSKFFQDCEFKLFKDGSKLWISEWDDKEEEYYTYSYTKQ